MCGIFGFITVDARFNKNEAQETLFNMCASIRYRGPDDYGIFLYGFDNPYKTLKVGLGHNRLSIIDLSSAGHQPMSNENGSVWLTCNGEVYNFLELKAHLLKKGHIFHSDTDIEVIIHSYEEWGQDCVNRFNGMFAFAIWDEKNEILLLARDRMGKKPLYYSIKGDYIIFSSEPKGILSFRNFEREIDASSLRKYFLYEYVPSPQTIYKNIKRLEAGNLLIWKNKTISIKKYWDISFNKKAKSEDAARLRGLIKDSVSKRLMSDVPLGIFLSGGIDSSAVVGLARELLPTADIKTFTIGFEDKSFDESSYARLVAKHFKTTHQEKILSSRMMREAIPEILNFLDEPFADASIIPTYLLSKFTREHVKISLGADGGDELFAGYDTFPAHRLALIYERLPFYLRHLAGKIIHRLPVSLDNLSFDFKLKQFIKGIPYPPALRNQIWLGSFSPQEQYVLFRDSASNDNDIFEDIHTSLQKCNANNYMEMLIYLYCKFYLQDDILSKVDRASMACSLEVRCPFLDYRLVELACNLPVNLKLKSLKTKYILKKTMNGFLPSGIINRPKKGFGIPVAKWIKEDLRIPVNDELSFHKIKRENLLNPSYVQMLLREHFDGLKDNRKYIWTIFMFELWYSKWFKKSDENTSYKS